MVPAAAVIPAPKVYANIVTVLEVEFFKWKMFWAARGLQ